MLNYYVNKHEVFDHQSKYIIKSISKLKILISTIVEGVCKGDNIVQSKKHVNIKVCFVFWKLRKPWCIVTT